METGVPSQSGTWLIYKSVNKVLAHLLTCSGKTKVHVGRESFLFTSTIQLVLVKGEWIQHELCDRAHQSSDVLKLWSLGRGNSKEDLPRTTQTIIGLCTLKRRNMTDTPAQWPTRMNPPIIRHVTVTHLHPLPDIEVMDSSDRKQSTLCGLSRQHPSWRQ